MTRVIKKPQVYRDLIRHARYIANDNPDAARRFLFAAEETFNAIQEQPKLGRVRRLRNPLLYELRQWPVKGFPKYLIFYQYIEPEIAVVRIIHGAQDINSILELEP